MDNNWRLENETKTNKARRNDRTVISKRDPWNTE